MTSPDKILADLSHRFVNRKVFKSITFSQEDQDQLTSMRKLVEDIGFDPDYYTAIHKNFDLPYDIYRPESENPRTQIEILQKKMENWPNSLACLLSSNPLLAVATEIIAFIFQRNVGPKQHLCKHYPAILHLIENDHFTPNKKTRRGIL